MGTTVGRNQGSPNSLFFIDVPSGQSQMSVSLKTADFNPDNSYTYELYNPSGQEVVADATPSTTVTPPNIGAGPSGLANLSVANPAAGRWLIVVQLNLTTSGNEFSQVVKGDVTFNNSGVTVLSGLPTSASTTLAQGSTNTVQLQITNTTGDRPDVHVLLQPGGTGRHRAEEYLHRGGRDEAGHADVDSERGADNGRHGQPDGREHDVGSRAKGHATGDQRVDRSGAPLHLHSRAAGRVGRIVLRRARRSASSGARPGRFVIGTGPTMRAVSAHVRHRESALPRCGLPKQSGRPGRDLPRMASF